jgi:hypothetical protein
MDIYPILKQPEGSDTTALTNFIACVLFES